MRDYILRRIMLMIPTLLGVSIIVFTLARLIPGDAVMLKLAEAPGFTQDQVARLRAELGLDKSLPEQYVTWLSGSIRGDFGNSLWTGKTVTEEIAKRLPVTIELAFLTLTTATVVAVTIGVISAVRQDTLADYLLRFFSILGLSVPSFWIGTLLVVFPAIWWNFLPPLTYIPFLDDPFGNLKQFLFPALAIGLRGSASIMRMVRSSLLEVLRQDYIRTAHAKGLAERTVIWGHALQNALLPVVTIVGTQFSALLGGTVIVESIFQLPGMGRLMLESINNRDYTLLQGNVMLLATSFLMMNLIVDLAYARLDPRIRY